MIVNVTQFKSMEANLNGSHNWIAVHANILLTIRLISCVACASPSTWHHPLRLRIHTTLLGRRGERCTIDVQTYQTISTCQRPLRCPAVTRHRIFFPTHAFCTTPACQRFATCTRTFSSMSAESGTWGCRQGVRRQSW